MTIREKHSVSDFTIEKSTPSLIVPGKSVKENVFRCPVCGTEQAMPEHGYVTPCIERCGASWMSSGDTLELECISVNPAIAGTKWIRIEDAPTNQRGLVWVKNGNIIDRGSCVAFGRVRRHEGDQGHYPSAEGYQGDFAITHWAPMPEAPADD